MEENTTTTPLPALNQPAPTGGAGKKYKILVVDDEPDARELFLDMLSAIDSYEVSSAVDGVDALAKAEATKFDLILLDIVMPRKDGVQTLSELMADKVKFGTPRVIMLTNIAGDLAIEEAMNLGAVGYKVKIDTEPDDLLKTVEEELKKLGQPTTVPEAEPQAPAPVTPPAAA